MISPKSAQPKGNNYLLQALSISVAVFLFSGLHIEEKAARYGGRRVNLFKHTHFSSIEKQVLKTKTTYNRLLPPCFLGTTTVLTSNLRASEHSQS